MPSVLLLSLDLAGTFVFALSGALLGVRRGLDAFGVAVLGVAAALGGGMVRDALLGATPAAALQDWRYLATALVAAGVTFVSSHQVARLDPAVRVLDAAGLGLFTVAGTSKALAFDLPALPAVALGVLTGIGGGVARDVLAGGIPLVLRRDVYALAALVGAVIVVVAHDAGAYGAGAAVAAAGTTFLVRLLALRFGWQAPRARGAPD